ncbi:monovalent cation/H(+) antiporter subunit G [Synechococcus sp. CS-1329]|jgi:multicomponent Na+:H+ antiporter subunit G|uniref:monovalent cation/H(+) antiporter subunit G n=1 Tax=Synechococcus sp. CS-1329 TaxID=2847975 RepID=UPI00223A702D|nr:monovalent cation/H(+) antiporter subunit G [Synechococcus sp. CS-1329]MCT0219517.1 monovalent cation/H(+) antiporter subunit G [Synechococcus sp. CS-1329]
MTMLTTVVSGLLLTSGLMFWLIGTWPLLGRSSYLAKLHGLSVADTLGSALIVLGLLVLQPAEWPVLSLALFSLVIWNTLFGYVLGFCSRRRTVPMMDGAEPSP